MIMHDHLVLYVTITLFPLMVRAPFLAFYGMLACQVAIIALISPSSEHLVECNIVFDDLSGFYQIEVMIA